MATLLNAKDRISELEYDLAKLKFVESKYPGYKLNYDKKTEQYIFSHKKISSEYSKYNIHYYSGSIALTVYDELDFIFNNEHEKIIIGCIPKICDITTIFNDIKPRKPSEPIEYDRKIVVYNLKFKSKNPEMRKKMQNILDLEIIKFIKQHSNIKLDEHIPERIKKLLIFS